MGPRLHLGSFYKRAWQVPKPGAGSQEWIPQIPIPPNLPTHNTAPGLVRKARQSRSYMAKRVQVIVCQLQLLEGNQLPHPVGPSGRRIRVDIEPSWHGGLSLPCHHPANRADGAVAVENHRIWGSRDSLSSLRVKQIPINLRKKSAAGPSYHTDNLGLWEQQ